MVEAKAERERLVAPCGIDCGNCQLHMAAGKPELIESLVARGIPREKVPCAGCRNIEGKCPVIQGDCATYTCVLKHAVEFCFECGEYPCGKLLPAADRAAVLPHNLKLYNLGVIRRDGVERFIAASGEIERTYFRGKMAVGKGPRLPAS